MILAKRTGHVQGQKLKWDFAPHFERTCQTNSQAHSFAGDPRIFLAVSMFLTIKGQSDGVDCQFNFCGWGQTRGTSGNVVEPQEVRGSSGES